MATQYCSQNVNQWRMLPSNVGMSSLGNLIILLSNAGSVVVLSLVIGTLTVNFFNVRPEEMTVSLSLRLARLREAILYAADSALGDDFRMSSSKRTDRLAMSIMLIQFILFLCHHFVNVIIRDHVDDTVMMNFEL